MVLKRITTTQNCRQNFQWLCVHSFLRLKIPQEFGKQTSFILGIIHYPNIAMPSIYFCKYPFSNNGKIGNNQSIQIGRKFNPW